MIGKIIIVNTIAAGNIPGPVSGVLKIGSQPKTELSHPPIGLRMGITTKIPHKPYTTLGIAAKSSIKNTSTVRIDDGKKFSLNKIAVPTPMGTANNSAIKALTMVP